MHCLYERAGRYTPDYFALYDEAGKILKTYSRDYVKKRSSGRQVLYNADGTPEKIILMGGPDEKMERVGEYPIGKGDTLTLKEGGHYS